MSSIMDEKHEAYKKGYIAASETNPDCPYDFVKQNELFHEWCDGYERALLDEEETP